MDARRALEQTDRADLLIAGLLPVMLAGVALLARRKQQAAREMAGALAIAEDRAAAAVADHVTRTRLELAGNMEEEVRARMARLTGLRLEAEQAIARRDTASGMQALETAGVACDDALAALRRFLLALPGENAAVTTPPPEGALAAALARGRRHRVTGDPALTPPGQLLAAARVLDELLSDDDGHATVRVDHRPAGLRVTLMGRGAGPPTLRDPMRLAGLRERVAAHDGTLSVDDAPWRWRVRVELPAGSADALPGPSWDPRRTDAAFGLFTAALVIVDCAVADVPNRRASMVAGILTAALPLAFRRRYPLTVCAVAGSGLVIGTPLDLVPRRIATTFEIAIVPFVSSAHAVTPRRSVAGVALLTGCGLVAEAMQGAEPPELALIAGLGASAGALAWFTRHHQGRALAGAVGVDELRRSHPQALDAALATERDRIARDLHDLVGHGVTLARVTAGAASVHVRRERWDDARAATVTLRDAVDETGRELQRLLRALRRGETPAGDRDTLDGLLRAVEQARRAGQPVTCVISDDVTAASLPTPVAAHAQRTVLEALTNARRHAGGGASDVTVELDDGDLVVSVLTTQGRSARTTRGSGRGLSALQRTAEELGGEFTAGPRRNGAAFGVWTRVPVG
ncbi:MAG: hypothetical protein JHC84_03550 [Solirubrobacteraceae bacterium]|nr:hypothetical protein [Solirubrobacteraceae bacterium]